LNNRSYILANGNWRVSPTSLKDLQDATKEADNNPTLKCRPVHAELVNDEAAALYSVSEQTDNAKLDSQVWISKACGLPLKSEMITDLGGGAAGKTHRSVHYEYSKVQAPAGVQRRSAA